MSRQYRIQYSRRSWSLSWGILSLNRMHYNLPHTLPYIKKCQKIILFFFPPNFFPPPSAERGGHNKLIWQYFIDIFSIWRNLLKYFRNIILIRRWCEWCVNGVWSDCVEWCIIRLCRESNYEWLLSIGD